MGWVWYTDDDDDDDDDDRPKPNPGPRARTVKPVCGGVSISVVLDYRPRHALRSEWPFITISLKAMAIQPLINPDTDTQYTATRVKVCPYGPGLRLPGSREACLSSLLFFFLRIAYLN